MAEPTTQTAQNPPHRSLPGRKPAEVWRLHKAWNSDGVGCCLRISLLNKAAAQSFAAATILTVQSTTALSPYRIPVIVMEATVSAVVSA